LTVRIPISFLQCFLLAQDDRGLAVIACLGGRQRASNLPGSAERSAGCWLEMPSWGLFLGPVA